jgi:predicted GH43/DUF377 family glycosyl hydrolase
MTAGGQARQLVTRSALRIRPNPERVIARLFVPGEEMPKGDSRAAAVFERILAMDDADVTTTLAQAKERYAHRHRHLETTWSNHFHLAARRLGRSDGIPSHRALLIGAYFTHEYSLEGAALFNPSIVAHPDQSGLCSAETRFVLSLRAVGEGHMSSIEFRSGTVDAAGSLRLDDPGAHLEHGKHSPGPYDRRLFHAKLQDHGCDNQTAALVLDSLEPSFGSAELEAAVAALDPVALLRAEAKEAVERIRWLAANNYTIEFPESTQLAERVLWPHGPTELQGMEDARFVRFADDAGAANYLATYTAFDKASVAPQLLATADFRTFRVCQLSGPSAANKGMALFPRKVAGHYMALSRWDRENLSVATSDDGYLWGEATTLRFPPRPWELVQVGNCGSPVETSQGWLVLTHGVGPMREYGIGAMLLDLDDPRQVTAALPEPLVVASEDERDGYVPNVVYSCGSLLHGEQLVLPYGFSDSAIGFALVDLPELLRRLTGSAQITG